MKKLVIALSFLLLIALLATSLVFSGCTKQPADTTSPAATAAQVQGGPTADNPIELTLAVWTPGASPIGRHMWESYNEQFEAACDHKIKINYKPDASMGAAPEHYELARSGMADISMIVAGFTPGMFPFTEITGMPMMFPNAEIAGPALYKFHQKYTWANEFKDVKMLCVIPTSPLQVLTNNKQVKTLEDMKGMKMIATEPFDVDVLNALGASAILMPEGETYTSLERGLADGRVHQADGMVTHKIMEVTKYRTFNANLKINCMQLVMNWDSWNSLPSDLQCKIDAMNNLSMSHHMGLVFEHVNGQMLDVVKAYDKKVGNPDIYYLPEEEVVKWKAAVEPLTEKWIQSQEAAGRPARAAVADVRQWVEEYKRIYLP